MFLRNRKNWFHISGLVVTNNDAYAEKLVKIRVHGSNKRYYHDEIGINGRLDSLQAVVLEIKLKYLNQWLKSREEKAQKYSQIIKNKGLTDHLSIPHVEHNNIHTYHQYTLQLRDNMFQRDKVIEHLSSHGIGSMVYYPVPLHLQQCFKFLGYSEGDYPQTEKCAQAVFSLPIFPELTDDEQAYVIKTIADFFA
ncbi:DegT/DnrJ/EryC1/StrS family aminotransferase [Candidatus Omnitrophota bacterium]